MKNKLIELLASKLKEKGLYDQDKYRKRLKAELQEIEMQGEYEYFLGIYDKGVHYANNENNLLVSYLLGVVDDFDVDKEPSVIYGDFPDVDMDYITVVRDYLKNEWAPKTFGADKVCSIGNYTTFGIKSALIDMARVHDLDRIEVLKLTTKLPNKDDDGKDLTLETAVSLNKDLGVYCQKHPEVADAAKRLVGRVRGKGKHAAGLIISKDRIDELVPLITDTDGTPISAWSEGLHTQDLQPVGLVKFDLLAITNLMQIGLCRKLIRERHGIDVQWTDDAYLNDPKALALANQAKLQCIFQFDSSGIREIVKKGGVDGFDDLVAYCSLYRPGPMNCLSQNTLISTETCSKKIKDLKTWHDKIKYLSENKEIKSTKRFLLTKTGNKKVFKIKTKSGKIIYSSNDHRFLTNNGYSEVKNLKKGDKILHSNTI